MNSRTLLYLVLGVTLGQALDSAWQHDKGWMITFVVATVVVVLALIFTDKDVSS